MWGADITQNAGFLATEASTDTHMPELSCHKRVTQGRKERECVLMCVSLSIYYTLYEYTWNHLY